MRTSSQGPVLTLPPSRDCSKASLGEWGQWVWEAEATGKGISAARSCEADSLLRRGAALTSELRLMRHCEEGSPGGPLA